MIEKVQRRATKIVPSLKHLTYPERLKELKIPTLSYRRIRGDMIETFKIMTGRYDKEVTPNLKIIDPDIPTRGHKYKLSKIRTTTTIRKNFFANRITNIWNSLPENIISASNVNTFKNRLDKHWQNQDIVYDYQAALNFKNTKLANPTSSRMQTDEDDPDLDTQDR